MKCGKMNAEIRSYFFFSKKKPIPVEHRSKFIKEYEIKSLDDLKAFSIAFKREAEPALKKLLAMRVIEMTKIYFEKDTILNLKKEFDIDPDDLYGAIRWRLPK